MNMRLIRKVHADDFHCIIVTVIKALLFTTRVADLHT